MRFLLVGDFHGKFPSKLKNKIKKEKFDYILCTGDLANLDKIRKYIFKYWTTQVWWQAIGIKKARKIEKESFDSGLRILKELNKSGKKVYLIWGNADFYKGTFSKKENAINPGYYEDYIKRFKNIILIDRKREKIKDLEVIGHGGYLDVTEFVKHPIDKDKRNQRIRLERYKKEENNLKKIFLNKKPKKFIFLIHYAPYKIMDKVKLKASPMYGKYVGWEPYNKVIKRYKPLFVICGHMHEYRGAKKLGKSIIINPGSAYESKAAILDTEKNKIKFL